MGAKQDCARVALVTQRLSKEPFDAHTPLHFMVSCVVICIKLQLSYTTARRDCLVPVTLDLQDFTRVHLQKCRL